MFELTDPSGRPAGQIEVMLKWKSTYVPPSGSIRTPEEPTFILKESAGRPEQELHGVEDEEKDEALQDEEEASRDHFHPSSSLTEAASSQVNRTRHGSVSVGAGWTRVQLQANAKLALWPLHVWVKCED